MARPTNFMLGLRNLIREEVSKAMRHVLDGSGSARKRASKPRRKRRGPGRPPGAKNRKRASAAPA